jgi:TolA-binding protein
VGADAGDPALAPDRAAVVALVVVVGRDSMPELGAALWRAAQGDTLGASHAMAAAARRLEGDGQAAALLWSARLAEAVRDTAGAEGLWVEIAGRYASSPAGAASLLGLARVAAARGQLAVAAARLEELILRNPDSALVPEARRELDRIRGLVPRS